MKTMAGEIVKSVGNNEFVLKIQEKNMTSK